ncbi:RNA recognition motif domain-containing protein [Mucilaginibacter ginsenosidivorans]|uniref:RNA-binding protein n=1 Tax=Mucilaginibacter ginsenosidivorans TaxID=398053 RepID=A0A5B8V3I5_9SPHI|nr:RNA-binding protein [Mucilaginibacter ginsenosidivorans]QEC65261.1 RNA-binding protein [Mucilaginibacter ginsenosidivorans]
MVKLFVSGFPLNMDEIELVKMFSLHGDVKTIKLVRDKKTRVCKGYGFIEMADMASAENAIAALNGEPMGDRKLTINIREDEPEAPAAPAAPAPRTAAPAERFSPRVFRELPKPGEPLKKKRPRRPM